MDAIDAALIEAWNRVAPRVRADRVEALKRAGRNLSRPVRAWCLCFRASDTRINPSTAFMEREPYHSRLSHRLVVPSSLVRELCRPVELPFEGVPLIKAAAMLGRPAQALTSMRKKGVFKERRLKMAGPGVARVKLWSPGLLDPNAWDLAAPDVVWGTLWQHLWERLPEGLEFHLRRVPDVRVVRGRERFWGWYFSCPGLGAEREESHAEIAEDAEREARRGCGRLVERLYIPLKPWTIAAAFGIRSPLDEVIEKDAGPWPFVPACRHCHRVRHVSLVDRLGWNDFVTCVSGGLLYGSEVERPRELVVKRKRQYVPQRRKLPGQERVLGMMLSGHRVRAIGSALGMTWRVVTNHVQRLYRVHGVRSRAGLFAKFGVEFCGTPRGDAPEEGHGGAHLPRQLGRVAGLVGRGVSDREAAREMGLSVRTVGDYRKRLYRLFGVHTRGELVGRLGAGARVEAARLKAAS